MYTFLHASHFIVSYTYTYACAHLLMLCLILHEQTFLGTHTRMCAHTYLDTQGICTVMSSKG